MMFPDVSLRRECSSIYYRTQIQQAWGIRLSVSRTCREDWVVCFPTSVVMWFTYYRTQYSCLCFNLVSVGFVLHIWRRLSWYSQTDFSHYIAMQPRQVSIHPLLCLCFHCILLVITMFRGNSLNNWWSEHTSPKQGYSITSKPSGPKGDVCGCCLFASPQFAKTCLQWWSS